MSPYGLGVADRSIDSGADGRRPHVYLQNQLLCLAEPVNVLQNGVGEGGKLLTKRHWHRVLELCAAHFDEAAEFLALAHEGTSERGHRYLQLSNAGMKRQLDRRGIHVVGRLAQVDMIVGMHN